MTRRVGCEDMNASDVAVGEVGKGKIAQIRWRHVMHSELRFALKNYHR